MAKFLDYQGLTQFWAKIKTWVYTAVTTNSPSKSKTVTGMQDGKVTYGNIGIDASQVETGTMPVARGGTGSGTAAGARSNLDVYSKAETESLVAGRIVVVQTLPASGQAGCIYYVGPSGSGGDQYEEYIWDATNSIFVKVGEKSLDLSEYVNDLVASGTGDYVIGIQKSGNVITFTKGSLPFATTSQKGIVQIAGSIGATVSSENNKAASEKAVRDAINALDANKTSTDGTNVQVKVTVTDGKVSAVNITTDNTENKNNKVTSWSQTTTDTHYPSEKLVKTSLDSKADKVASATEGNFAGLDANGNPTDSGKSAADFATADQGNKADNAIQGVKLAGAASPLTPDSNRHVTIPNAVATGATGATNGLMTADDKKRLGELTKVEASSTNGNIKIDGTETTVYAHPTTTAASAAAKKVGKDALGHVVLGEALTKSDVGLGNVDNTADSNKNVLSATKLTTARKIDGVSFDGTADIIHYCECPTEAGTAAKVVTLPDAAGFVLAAGASLYVKFQYTNSVASPTLNVNGTGAKAIYRYGTTTPGTTAATSWQANSVEHLVYDGAAWRLVGWLNDNTTYSNASLGQGYGTCTTAEATAAKVVTLSSYTLATGGIVAVKFSYGLCASATMNVNGKGAKNIFIHGAAVTSMTAKLVKAGDIAYFIYDGTQYHFLGTDRMEKDAVIGFSDAGTAGTDAKVQYEKGDGTKGDLMV
ncbi:MAG: hypothetical protein J6T62_03840, partial [Fibrobacter sp.]|nr:hypothetical protein [Fibrobacter sp.]